MDEMRDCRGIGTVCSSASMRATARRISLAIGGVGGGLGGGARLGRETGAMIPGFSTSTTRMPKSLNLEAERLTQPFERKLRGAVGGLDMATATRRESSRY